MGACEQACRNSFIVVPAFFLIFGGLILMFVGAAFSPNVRADGITFSREARLSISVPCIVTGAVLTSLGILHCVTMAVCLPLVKQYLQRSQGNKLAREGDTGGPDDTISVVSDDILAAEGEGVAIGPKRRREVPAVPEVVKPDDEATGKDDEAAATVQTATSRGVEAGHALQPAKETAAVNSMFRTLQQNITMSSRRFNPRSQMV